ncbi:SMP-30/gluconolactonase/LRE family protein [Metabacillus arenae]|uniref:SMP-30/gluconolactonase/LRE family protein n=1 Tax=Metabacillus arenae TaxID=2771434 RepID=A0A926NN15_9BACI|nr:SMP-30/gluconolactonase/LRE family protein [Metabacillus arenae]MBD1380997.1 SMP-30/gluconolactonase/LRE family protein [Metabacillus arenae]
MNVEQLAKLQYKQVNSIYPIIGGECNLQTVNAEPWLKVSDEGITLEGLCFDRQGNLYFVDCSGDNVCRGSFPDREIKIIYHSPGLHPAAVKIHKDGRLFVCAVGDLKSTGCILAMQPDGSDVEEIVPPSAGYCVNDMVFDQKGGFYFTDFKGIPTNTIGGVYYVSPDFGTILPVLQNMAAPNGVALSKNQKYLWVTEFNANRLHHINLLEDGIQIAPYGAFIPYTFTGYRGPDSCCIDSNDNLYVAMARQGRVLIFNKTGFPIGQVLIPGRDKGNMVNTTHPAFIPGTDQLIICTNDGTNGGGAWVYIARGFTTGHLGYQFSE